MIVSEVMNPDVKTVKPEMTVQDAAEMMKDLKVGCLIVVRETSLAGIVTERDIIDKVVAEALNSSKVKVKDIMSPRVVMISPDKEVGEAAEIMAEKKIKKLPVLQGKRIVGIVTATDLCFAEPKLIEQIGELIMTAKKKTIAG